MRNGVSVRRRLLTGLLRAFWSSYGHVATRCDRGLTPVTFMAIPFGEAKLRE